MARNVTLFTILALVLIAMPVVSANYDLPEACTIMTLQGFLLDSDCDGVHDDIDNCMSCPNAEQYDSNRNGLGDECDLLIEHVTINPSTILRANEFFGAHVTVLNNWGQPLYDVEINVENTDLGVDVTTSLPVFSAGEAKTTEFLLKVPRCTPERDYVLDITTTYFAEGQQHVETTTQKIKVVAGGECNAPVTLLENTIVETFFEHDLDVGEAVILPIRVLNLNSDAIDYQLRVEGMSFGAYRIDPDTAFTLPSGHETTRYLAIETETWAPLGTHQLAVVITANGEEEKFPITLNVRKPLTNNAFGQLKQALEVTLILVLFILLIVGFIIAYKKMNDEGKE